MAHADILDDRESLRSPLLGSVIFHAALFGSFVLYTWWVDTHTGFFGKQEPLGGGSVGISAVKSIPLPSRSGATNPLANDTESRVPTPEKQEARKRHVEPEKDAVQLKSKRAIEKPSPREENQQRFHAQKVEPNQVTSSVGQALVTRMIQKTGSGGVGANTNSALGNRFGWYLDLVKQRIAEKWDTTQLDARVQSAPIAIVVFEIRQDGSVSNVGTMQSSGIPALDYSAQRAITEAAPFPSLPGGYSTAPMEIWFQLKR